MDCFENSLQVRCALGTVARAGGAKQGWPPPPVVQYILGRSLGVIFASNRLWYLKACRRDCCAEAVADAGGTAGGQGPLSVAGCRAMAVADAEGTCVCGEYLLFPLFLEQNVYTKQCLPRGSITSVVADLVAAVAAVVAAPVGTGAPGAAVPMW